MKYKEKIIKELSRGYAPEPFGSKEEYIAIYNRTFKPLVDKKDLSLFIELFGSNEIILRAWSILGIYHVLKNSTYFSSTLENEVKQVIKECLYEKREVRYFSIDNSYQAPLREHHLMRICDLEKVLINDPVLEYIESYDGKTDFVVGELMEKIITPNNNSAIESLLIKLGKNVVNNDFSVRLNIIKSFENQGKNQPLINKSEIETVFRTYLSDIKEDTTEKAEKDEQKRVLITNKKRKLKENLVRIAAVLGLDLKAETLAFINSLDYPYRGLSQIAQRYSHEKEFTQIILSKIEETCNPSLITELLKAIIVIKEGIENWKEIVLEKTNNFCITDGDLIEEMQITNILNEQMIVNYLVEGGKWQVEFFHEFLLTNHELLTGWPKLNQEFQKILHSFEKLDKKTEEYLIFRRKKEVVLKLILDLDEINLVESCLDNFIKLDDSELKKMCLFAIIKSNDDAILTKLRAYMDDNPKEAAFVKNFWQYLKNRDWKYYY